MESPIGTEHDGRCELKAPMRSFPKRKGKSSALFGLILGKGEKRMMRMRVVALAAMVSLHSWLAANSQTINQASSASEVEQGASHRTITLYSTMMDMTFPE